MTAVSGRGRRTRRMLLAVALSLGAVPHRADGVSDSWTRVHISDKASAFAVRQSLSGASRLLADPACQAVFSDFRDATGAPLYERLLERGQTGRSYLPLLHFHDATDHAHCRVEGVLAFTSPGHPAVFICGRKFHRTWMISPKRAEVTIVHEMLHTLGLGENPPTSEAITAHIRSRCRK